jgi:hypothetical protein
MNNNINKINIKNNQLEFIKSEIRNFKKLTKQQETFLFNLSDTEKNDIIRIYINMIDCVKPIIESL